MAVSPLLCTESAAEIKYLTITTTGGEGSLWLRILALQPRHRELTGVTSLREQLCCLQVRRQRAMNPGAQLGFWGILDSVKLTVRLPSPTPSPFIPASSHGRVLPFVLVLPEPLLLAPWSVTPPSLTERPLGFLNICCLFATQKCKKSI